MSIVENKEKLMKILNQELGLTPYEAKAYITLLLHGPLTPQGINRESGIPRPRTYDVLNSLAGKSLLMEQPGRPTKYAAVDPRVGMEKMMVGLEQRTLRQLEEKKKIAERMSASLSRLREKNQQVVADEEAVWVTRRENAMIAKYTEAIRNIKEEFVVASASPRPPEKELLDAIRYALKRNKTVRVIRPINGWTRKELEEYEELIQRGEQIKHLEYDGLTFAIFDRKETVLWFPPYPSTLTAWVNLPSLSAILYEHFEMLWKKGQPALPILRKLREART